MISDRYSVFEHAACEQGAGSSDGCTAGSNGTGTEAGAISHLSIMFQHGTGVYDAKFPNNGSGVDDSARHDAGTRTYFSCTGYDGRRVDDGGEGDVRAQSGKIMGDAFAGIVIADGDVYVQAGIGCCEFRQQRFVAKDLISHEVISNGFEGVEDPQDMELSGSLGHVDDDACVAGGPEDEQGDEVHGTSLRQVGDIVQLEMV